MKRCTVEHLNYTR